MKKSITPDKLRLLSRSYFSRLTKTAFFILTLCIWVINDVQGQNMGYSFASSSGTYTPITGGTAHSSGSAMDDATFSVTLPFTFTFNGTAYTQVYVSENGYVSFGATNPGTSTRSAISSTNTGFEVAAPFSGDLQGVGVTSEMRSQTIGTAPNRTFIAQWTNLQQYLGSGLSYSFQLQIDEANGVTTNQVVRFVYGTVSSTSASNTYQVGLRGLNNTIYQNRTTTTAWASTTAGTSNAAACTVSSTVAPASGLTFTLAPIPMTYTSSTTVQSATSPVIPSSVNQQIIHVQVVTGGGAASPLTLTQLNLNTNGSTSTANIANAKVYYTGTTNTFSTATQFGSTVTSPGATYNVTGSQALALGTNYFWVTYDIVASPTLGNVVDGECTQITVSSSNYAPTATAPAGSRPISTPLSGNYNIGASGNYPTLTAAVTSLNSSGVSGPVTFTLTDANYSTAETFPIIINQFSGSSAVNTLTIKPASGLVTTITGSATSLITLNGADNIIIDGSAYGNNSRELNLINNSTSTSAVIQVSSLGTGLGSRNVTIQNCNIQGGSSTVTGVLGIFAGGTTVSTSGTGADNDKLSIINNSISKAYYGIYCRGVASSGMNDTLIISNNSIGSNTASTVVLFSGIDVQNATLATINNNTIFNMTQPSGISTSPAAINLGGTLVTANVHSNVINGVRNPSSGGWGAYGINVAGTVTTMNIYNNAISDISTMNYSTTSTTFNAFGIRVTVGGTYRIYNNSIHLFGSVPNVGTTPHFSACIVFVAGTSVDMRNNILVNSQTGLVGAKSYAIYSTVAATAFATTTNYNNYFVSGTNGLVGYIAAADQATLTAWKTAMGAQRDSVSLSVNPAFNSNTIIRPTAASPILNTGTPLAMTATDLLGVTRNATTPAMGAYEQGGEYIPPVITFTALTNVFASSNRLLSAFANISDTSGSINTTAGTRPRLYFKKSTNANAYVGNTSADNGWKWVEATNTTSPFDFNMNFALLTGGSVTPGDQIQYFVVAQDMSATPNVTVVNNNFIRTAPSSVALTASSFPIYGYNTFNIVQLLSGNINVGAGQTYTSLTNAGGLFEMINNNAVSGNINVFVKSNLAETGAVALNQTIESGAGNYSITIQPDSSQTRTISGSFAGGLVRLNGADRIIFDGRYLGSGNFLTFQNLQSSGTTACIHIASLGNNLGAVSNTVRNCNFVMPRTGVISVGVSSGGSTVSAFGSDNDSLSLLNNYVRSASIGFQVFGNIGFNHDVVTITGNVLDTMSRYAISVGSIRSFTIASNTVNNIFGTSGITLYGIVGADVTNGTVSQNTVTNVQSLNQNAWGIYLGNNDSAITVSRNNISRILHSGTSGWGGKGIGVNSGFANSNIELSNNFVYNISGDGHNTIGSNSIVGILISGNTGGVRVNHNTVYMYGSIGRAAATNDVSAAFSVSSPTTSNLDVRNNIFRNAIVNTTGVQKSYAIYHAGTNISQFSNLAYNNYLAEGPEAVMGYLNAADVVNMGAWKTATVTDSLSQNRVVNFVDSSDLHLTGPSNGDLYLRAPRIASIGVDYDNVSRTAVTYMGADQASASLAMIVNAGTDKTVCNGSGVEIGSASIVSSGGIAPYTYSWNPAATAVANPTVSPVTNTTYIVTVTDTFGFTGTDTVNVIVNNAVAGNSATANQTICSGSTPTALAGTTPTGGNGSSYTYAWISSTTSSSAGFAAAGGTNNTQNYTPGALTQNTWYKRIVTSGVCNADTSVALAITVNAPVATNTASGNQTICSGSTPTALTGSTPTGGTGTFTYAWLSSTTSATAGFAAATGTNNTQNYTPAALTANTWYRRRVTSGVCNADTSAAVAITVNAAGTWTGTTSNAWNNTANWSCPLVPTSSTHVTINSGAPNMPVITDAQQCNNLTINTGATLTLNNAASRLSIFGSISNSGTLTHSNGTISLSGSSAQTLPGGTYNKLQVNNSAGINAGGAIVLNDSLLLTSGVLTLGSNNLTMGNASYSSTGSTTSYVRTNSTGRVVVNNVGAAGKTGSVIIPVGNSTYNGVVLSNTGTADAYTVWVIDSVTNSYTGSTPTGAKVTSNAVNRTWIINESVAGGSNATVSLVWSTGDELGGFNRGASYVSRYNGTTWMGNTTSAATGANPYTQTRTGITAFSPFGVGSGGTLPVALLNFYAEKQNKAALLVWETASETNNDRFEVERSTDGKLFTRIQTVKGNGTTNNKSAYQLLDGEAQTAATNAGAEVVYYRLKQVDMDGSISYSETRMVNMSNGVKFLQVQPNPYTSEASVVLQSMESGKAEITITDIKGSTVTTQTVHVSEGYNEIALEGIDNLKAGMYFVTIKQGDEVTVLKLTRKN